MKRVFIVVVAFLCLVLMMGAAGVTTTGPWFDGKNAGKRCLGYTIIAFDKGVDCHGDTIQLVRKNGFAERVSSD